MAALAALTGEPEEALEPRLRGLVHREILQLDTDPRSPERGQFGFTQALVREVAYSTLGRRDRRAKHLAAARYYESLGDDEVAGVLATHYVDAYEAAPEGPEGEAVATQARLALRGAADRATALGAHESAIVHWERARTVTADPAEEADLLEKIGLANRDLGHFTAAEAAFRDALARYQALDDRVGVGAGLPRPVPRPRVGQSTLGLDADRRGGRRGDRRPRPPPGPGGALACARDRATASSGDRAARSSSWTGPSSTRSGCAWRTSSTEGLGHKGSVYWLMGRTIEGRALVEASLKLAERVGAGPLTARATFSLSLALYDEDPRAAVETGPADRGAVPSFRARPAAPRRRS